jgi:hypothetical protein
MDAVAKGEIDVAIVWGPVAGYFASREDVPLKVALVMPQNDDPRLPMVILVEHLDCEATEHRPTSKTQGEKSCIS